MRVCVWGKGRGGEGRGREGRGREGRGGEEGADKLRRAPTQKEIRISFGKVRGIKFLLSCFNISHKLIWFDETLKGKYVDYVDYIFCVNNPSASLRNLNLLTFFDVKTDWSHSLCQ